MKAIVLAVLMLVAAEAVAEDWMGYVMRFNYQGRDWYWVYDDALDKGQE